MAHPLGLTEISIQDKDGNWTPLQTVQPSFTEAYRVYSRLRACYISSQKSKGSPDIGKMFTERGLKSWVRLVIRSKWGEDQYFVLKYRVWTHGPIELVKIMSMTDFMGERSR